MQITKSTKKQKQQQQQQQQPQQQPLQQPQAQLEPNKPNKMFKVSMFKVDKSKLVLVVVACLVTALIARGFPKTSVIDATKSDLDAKLKEIEAEQILVRNYVKGLLATFDNSEESTPTGGVGASASGLNSRQRHLANYLFAKMVLNAYDRPYGHVIDAIGKIHEKLNAVNQQDAATAAANANMASHGNGLTQQQQNAQQLLIEAYGRALEDSQKHSVMIQDEIRRQQERVPNEEGKQSQVDRLRELAQFESRLIGGYLKEALSSETST